MADKGAQDKTEKPTPRRRSKAREQGQVAKSQEAGSVAVLIAGLAALSLFFSFMYGTVYGFTQHTFSNLHQFQISTGFVHELSLNLMGMFAKLLSPVMGAVVVAAVLINLAQVGILFALKKLKPDLKRLNPLEGIKKFMSVRILVDLAKNLGKLFVVGSVAWFTLLAEWDNLNALSQSEIAAIALYILEIMAKIFWRSLLVMIVLAVLDWAYQKYDYEKNLKMSKQEVKDEFKQSEGDPHVKARIRSIQRDQARKRMMADVPSADVVITNPTHFAVALKYEGGGASDAPMVTAKGANKVAARIKELAAQANVPIIEDKPLAQALYRQVEVGQEIPYELYEAVAGILAHVYRLKNKHLSYTN